MCKEKEHLFDRPDLQQSQPASGLNPDLMRLLHSELEANPGAPSTPKFDAALKEYLDKQLKQFVNSNEDEDQIMDEKELWRDLFEREQYFHDGAEWELSEAGQFLSEFEGLCKGLEVDISRLDRVTGLRLIYSRTYDFIVASDRTYPVFGRTTSLYEAVFKACMFTGLCMFLHNTKRLKGSTISQYVYAHSRAGFSDEDSSNYIKHEGKWKQGERTEALDSSERTMRQFRHRLFKSRPVDNRRPEWSAIPETSKYEWLLYFDYADADGKADPQLRETLKRIKNLYNGVYKAIDSSKDDGYEQRLKDAYAQFQSKLKKIRYEDYLALCKALLEHIEKERADAGKNWLGSTYYGINLYRFEKELRLFELTNDVKQMLKSKNEQEVAECISKSVVLQGICFPQIRDKFGQCDSIEDVGFMAHNFSSFITRFIALSRLLVDKFIEDGYWGESWESLFLAEINGMAEQVLYDPKNIDYSVERGSQVWFEGLLIYSTGAYVNNLIELWHHNPQPKDDKK